ncbi:MAG TPA: tRNA pseudouridine(38-40) synthase TruA [Acidimicrobiales bacterium]|nr:tRNA pseudouridine(38-40) synthase TruA [Acidimicrobiales bacterium]
MTLFDNEHEAAALGSNEPAPPLRVRMTVAYDGSQFHGFAPQPEVATVAGKLVLAIERALRVQNVDLVCAGRTDSGVHARGQVVSFDVPAGARVDADELTRRVNRQTAPAVVVRDTAIAPDFDARHDATARRYRYTIVNGPVPDPLLASQAWWVPEPLDLRAMQAACDPLLGEHDFAAFCRKPTARCDGTIPGTTRRVTDAEWEEGADGLLYFWIEANAFCHQMVRSIVGLLVDVGKAKRQVSDVMQVLRGLDRQANAEPAPPHGLVLWAVTY